VLGELRCDDLECGLDLRLVRGLVLAAVLDGDAVAAAGILDRVRGERLAVITLMQISA
jgi:hypothetical protein